MSAENIVIDIDDQSEEGEIRRSSEKDYYTDEENAETADSLQIKPPQAAIIRHRKTTSSSSHRNRDEKHNFDRRENKERKSRHHEDTTRHRDKHKDVQHRRQDNKTRRSDPTKRSRESSRHERKERSAGDRILEDLRESNSGRNNHARMTNSRLLDKRRERREESHNYKMQETTITASRSRTSVINTEEVRISREIRVEELRERREMRIAAAAAATAAALGDHPSRSKHSRTNDRQDMASYAEELLEQQQQQYRSTSGKEKKHKRSHKHERKKERERELIAQHEKQTRNQHQQMEMNVYEELERMEAIAVEQHLMMTKESRELTEQELRRQRLLQADREMARRKESSRLELEARRMKRGEKRQHSPDIQQLQQQRRKHSPELQLRRQQSPEQQQRYQQRSPEVQLRNTIGDLSDDLLIINRLDEDITSNRSKVSDEEIHGASSMSSISSSEDEDSESKESDEESEYNNPSPLSVGQLAKSDRSDGDSPKYNNGAQKDAVDIIEDEAETLPPYFPAIQGCRSVEEYKCLNRIAEGTYGVVYRAEDRRSKEIVALKRLKMEKEKDGFPITSLREINTLLKAQHPNIVTVREIVVGSNMDKIFIVMDYVEHDLKSLMETMKSKNQSFMAGEIKCIMQQLLKAVAHLHDNWILHRDLKTSNLLLSHKGILKVGDFGLAREYGSPLKQYTSIVVTLWYRAPELLLGSKEYSTPIDMWSVGCIFAELIRMEALFPGKSEIDLLNRVFKELGSPNEKIWPAYSKLPMVKKIPFAHYPVNNLKQRFNLALSDTGIELLNKFLTYNPAQRITAEDAMKHGYFTETPLPIDPSMFPTWPAKSEFGARTINASPKPPSGGKEFKQLSDKNDEEETGFHMGSREASRQLTVGGGFHLKF